MPVTTSDMIRYFYKHSTDATLAQHSAHKPGAWTYVETPTAKELEELVVKHGLSLRFLKDALDIDEIPRLETAGRDTYIFTRYAYEKSANQIETAPVLFVVNEHSLFTISAKKLPVLSDVISKASTQLETTNPVRLMLQLLHEINIQYDQFINDYHRQVRVLRDRLGKRDVGTKDFIQFVRLEDDLNDFISALEPTNAALKRLLTERSLPQFAKQRDKVDTVLLNNEQLTAACNANLKTIDSLRRTYALVASNNLDRSINWLSIAAVVIAIPTLIYSLYGMNMPLPFQKETWLFPVVLIISLLAGLAVFAYGRRKHLF